MHGADACALSSQNGKCLVRRMIGGLEGRSRRKRPGVCRAPAPLAGAVSAAAAPPHTAGRLPAGEDAARDARENIRCTICRCDSGEPVPATVATRLTFDDAFTSPAVLGLVGYGVFGLLLAVGASRILETLGAKASKQRFLDDLSSQSAYLVVWGYLSSTRFLLATFAPSRGHEHG